MSARAHGRALIQHEQRDIERFVKREYWRLAADGSGRFAFTRAPLTRRAQEGREHEAGHE